MVRIPGAASISTSSASPASSSSSLTRRIPLELPILTSLARTTATPRRRAHIEATVATSALSPLLWLTSTIFCPPEARKTNRDHLRAAQMYGIESRFPGTTDHHVEGRCAWRFATTSWGRFLRRHGRQRHSMDSLHVQGSCEILTGA